MNKKEIENQYRSKIKLINEYNKFYYDKSKPKVSDKQYDDLKKAVLELEFRYKFLKSKNSYLEYLSSGENHAKHADSLYELSRVHLELNEIKEAKNLLTQMLEDYPEHILFNKASLLLQSLQ